MQKGLKISKLRQAAQKRTFGVKSKHDFWSLSGSLKSKMKLTDSQLMSTRRAFTIRWSEQDGGGILLFDKALNKI